MSENQTMTTSVATGGDSANASTQSIGNGTTTVQSTNNQGTVAQNASAPGLDWQQRYAQAESLLGKQGQELGSLKQTLESLVKQQETQKGKLAEYFGITQPEAQKGFIDQFFDNPETALGEWVKGQLDPIASEISQIKLEKFQAQQVAQQQEVESAVLPHLGEGFINKVRQRISSMPNPNRFNDPQNAHLSDNGKMTYGLEQIYKRGYASVFYENLGNELASNFPDLVASLDQQRQNSLYARQRAKGISGFSGGGAESSPDSDFGVSYRVKRR